MTVIEALEFARQKETEAASIYEKFALEHPVIKDLCYLLLNEEEKHRVLIDKKIAELQK